VGGPIGETASLCTYAAWEAPTNPTGETSHVRHAAGNGRPAHPNTSTAQ